MNTPFFRPSVGSRASLLTSGALTGALVLSLATSAVAQDRSITWTEATRIEVPGTFGAFLQAMPGALDSRESRHGLHIMGRRIREDHGSTSTIMDLDEGRWISVDHDSRSYVEFSTGDLAGLAQMYGDMAAELDAELQSLSDELQVERDEAMQELRAAMEEASAEMEVRIEIRSPGERQNVAGFSAERHLILAEVGIREEVRGVDSDGDGTLVFLVDLWQTDAFPSADALYEEWALGIMQDPEMQRVAEQLAETMGPVTGAAGPETLAAWDPRIAGGLDRLAEAMETLDGTSVRSAVTVAVVPNGVELDESALLAWEPTSMGAEIQAAAGDAARGAVQDAARGAISGLGGRFGLGGGGGQPEPEPEEPETVHALLRVTTEIRDVEESATVSADLFAPATGYTRQELPTFEGLLEEIRQDR